jgi:serine phosphatase RsbU (regulator of sigma subunit)
VSNNGELNKFKSRHLPLGVVDTDVFDAATEIFHAPPGVFLLCSDGLTEAENASGEPFGEARFESLLKASSPDKLFDNILSALETHLGGCAAHDDLSMVLARCGV